MSFAHDATAPGTVTASALSEGIDVIPRPAYRLRLAAAGAQPEPLSAMISPSPRRIWRTKQSPPMPVCVASTTPSSAMAATAASIALPPRRSTSSAVSVASGCDVAAMTRVPNASERPGSSKSRAVLLQNGKRRVPQIRDQHRGRRVGDAQRRSCILHGQLRSKSAGPEHRQLVVGDLRVTDIQIAPAQIHANAPGVAEMDRSAVNVRETRRDLNSADGIGWREGSHGHHQRALERPRRDGVDIGHIHSGDIVAFEEFQPHAGLLQGLLERKRAAEGEGHEVVAPVRADVGHFLDECAVAEDVIARNIGADIEVVGKRRQAWVADIGAGDQRAWLGIALTIKEKVLGPFGRKNADIGLYETRRDAGRVAGIRTGADRLPCSARI